MAFSYYKEALLLYNNYIKQNPTIATEIESALRWISFLTSGRFKNSHVISELIYSSANLLQVFNDLLFRRAADIKIFANDVVERLYIFLTVLECTEVFSEFTGERLAGEFGKWIIAAIIQTTKAVIKLVLLIKYNQGMSKQTPIPALDRRMILNTLRKRSTTYAKSCEVQGNGIRNGLNGISGTITLKRSGRLIRTIESSPPRSKRTWTLKNLTGYECRNLQSLPSALNNSEVLGEIMHIIRPVTHLSAMATFGTQAWTPFFISLGMDLTSLRMLNNPNNVGKWNANEKIEIGHRTFILLMYFMRSPFFDRYTKMRIIRMLKFSVDNIPIIGRIIRPCIDYLPEWQKTYFYVWGV